MSFGFINNRREAGTTRYWKKCVYATAAMHAGTASILLVQFFGAYEVSNIRITPAAALTATPHGAQWCRKSVLWEPHIDKMRRLSGQSAAPSCTWGLSVSIFNSFLGFYFFIFYLIYFGLCFDLTINDYNKLRILVVPDWKRVYWQSLRVYFLPCFVAYCFDISFETL